MKDIKVVLEYFSTQGIVLDNAQASFLEEFISIDSKLKPKLFFSKNNNYPLYKPKKIKKVMRFFSNSVIRHKIYNRMKF